MKSERYFNFREGCRLVYGSKKGAIYDIVSGDIYSLDAKILRMLDSGRNKKVSEIEGEASGSSRLSSDIVKHISQLGAFGLSYLTDRKLHVHNIEGIYENRVTYGSFNKKANLKTLVCEITNECRYECIHCDENTASHITCSCFKNRDCRNKRLMINEWADTVQNAWLAGCRDVMFIGGDPLLNEGYLERLLSISYKLKYQNIKIYTNGSLLDDDMIRGFKQFKASLVIPFYSIDANVHDSITRIENAHNMLMRNIHSLREHGMPFRLSLLIFRQNESTVHKTLKYLCRYGIDHSVNCYRSPDPLKKHLISETWVSKLRRSKPQISRTLIEDFMLRKLGNRCWLFSAAVKNNGDVIPCIRARSLVAGNITEYPLIEILRREYLNKYWFLSKDNIAGCKECEYRYACDDCPVTFLKGDKISNIRNPNCDYDPQKAEWH